MANIMTNYSYLVGFLISAGHHFRPMRALRRFGGLPSAGQVGQPVAFRASGWDSGTDPGSVVSLRPRALTASQEELAPRWTAVSSVHRIRQFALQNHLDLQKLQHQYTTKFAIHQVGHGAICSLAGFGVQCGRTDGHWMNQGSTVTEYAHDPGFAGR